MSKKGTQSSLRNTFTLSSSLQPEGLVTPPWRTKVTKDSFINGDHLAAQFLPGQGCWQGPTRCLSHLPLPPRDTALIWSPGAALYWQWWIFSRWVSDPSGMFVISLKLWYKSVALSKFITYLRVTLRHSCQVHIPHSPSDVYMPLHTELPLPLHQGFKQQHQGFLHKRGEHQGLCKSMAKLPSESCTQGESNLFFFFSPLYLVIDLNFRNLTRRSRVPVAQKGK